MLQDTNLQDYTLDVKLKELLWKELFGESFKIKLQPEFVANTEPKQHGFKNHVNGFVGSLKQNSSTVEKQVYKKRDIYVVSFGMNTWSEINWDRPALVFKEYAYGDDVLVIPITSAGKQSKWDAFDIYVTKDKDNTLFQSSFARLRQLRAVSVKRVGRKIGTLTNEAVKESINEWIKKMLGMDK